MTFHDATAGPGPFRHFDRIGSQNRGAEKSFRFGPSVPAPRVKDISAPPRIESRAAVDMTGRAKKDAAMTSHDVS